MRFGSACFAVLVAVGVAGAQDGGFRWSLSGGPTIRAFSGRGDLVCFECDAGGWVYWNDRIIFPADHQKLNASIGLSKHWAGSAITMRGEVIYNRAVSDGRVWRYKNDSTWPPIFISDTTTQHQSAPREELIAATLGLQWDAFPAKRISPYLLTSIGLGRSRVSWNSDTLSARLDVHRLTTFVPLSLGAGLRAKIGKHEAFAEWRKFGAFFSDSPRIAPFSLGFRF